MAEGDVQPVVIPVEVRPDFSRLEQMPEAIRRARDAPGVLGEDRPGGGMAPPTVASPLDQAKLATLREYQALETNLRAVNVQFARLAQLAAGSATATAETTPAAALPAGASGGGAAPPGGGVPPPSPSPGPAPRQPAQPAGIDVGQLMQTLLYGGAATVGLGIGVGAMFQEFGRMIATAKQSQEGLYLAAQGAGFGGASETPSLQREILRPQGRYLAMPQAAIGITTQLRRLGLRDDGSEGRELAELGHMTGTDAGGTAAETYRIARRDPGTALQTSVLEFARQGQLGAGETLDLLRQLVRLSGQNAGQYQRSAEDLNRTGDLVAVLSKLPGQVGRGQGGADIAGAVQSGSQSGLGSLLSMAAFRRRHPDMPLSDPSAMRLFYEEQESPEINVPGVLREAQRDDYGGDENVKALRLRKQMPGLTMHQASAVVRGGPEADAQIKRITEQESRAAIQRENALGVKTPGGADFQVDADRTRSEGPDTWLSGLVRNVNRVYAAAPGTTATIAGGASLALLGRAMLRGGSMIGAGKAGMIGRLGANIGRVPIGKLVGRGLGAVSAAGDVASLATGTPDWWGVAGGAAGAVAGGFLGGPGGALTGYGLGRTAVEYGRSLVGGPARADAAELPSQPGRPAGLAPIDRGWSEASMAPSGWQRDEVTEHLALLRQLVLNGPKSPDQPQPGKGGMYTGGFGGAGSGAASTVRPSENGPMPAALQPQEGAVEQIQRLAGGPEAPSPLASRELPATLRLQEQGARGPASPYQQGELGGGEGKIAANDPRLVAAAKKFGIPLNVAQGLVKQESGFKVGARGGAGEYGLTQLMPGTAREMGVEHPLDAQENLEGGFGYLRKQIDYFKGRGLSEEEATKQGLAAYNAGRGGALKGGGQGYSRSVMANAERFAASGSANGAEREPSAAAQATAQGTTAPRSGGTPQQIAAATANPAAGVTSRNADGTLRIQGETAGMSRDVDARGKIVATHDAATASGPQAKAAAPTLSASDLAMLQRERELQVAQHMQTPARDPVAERSQQVLASKETPIPSPVKVHLSLDSEIQGMVAARTEQPGARQRVGG